jgi:hypothetical protein
MKSKVFFLAAVGLLLLFLMGCGGSYGGSGSTYLSIVGTWNKDSFTGDGANLPDQLIFNTNGTGSFSGTASGAANFTWTYRGITLSLIPQQGGTIILTAPLVGTVTSPLTLTTSTSGTAIYIR